MKCLIPLLLFILFPTLSYALDFTEFGMLTYSGPRVSDPSDPSLEVSRSFSWGGGITLGFKVFQKIDIEPGIIYGGSAFSTTSNQAPNTDYSMTHAHFPLVVRYWLSDVFSAGGGVYYTHGTGNINITQNGITDVKGYNDLLWNTDDIGFVMSLRFRSPINDLMSFVIDGRFLLGTRNMDNSETGKSFMTREFQGLAGIAFIL
jgi:hypothetical protein